MRIAVAPPLYRAAHGVAPHSGEQTEPRIAEEFLTMTTSVVIMGVVGG